MRRTLTVLIVLGFVALATGLWVTRPRAFAEADFVSLSGDATRGEMVYWAAGCASCHAEKDSDDKLSLPGGEAFVTEFGTFYAPNISQHPEVGIGTWSLAEFASAVKKGTSPEGQHYFPVFPYASYARMTDADVADLWAFMRTLPAAEQPNRPHDLKIPYNLRVSLGGWKLLFLDDDWVWPAETDEVARGRYLVEALGHCGECHTPRNALGGLDTEAWLSGAPNPSGEGRIPSLLPPDFTWAEADIAYYLETGFTPDFDSAGGSMVSVVDNISRLAPEDRAAIAAYVKAQADG